MRSERMATDSYAKSLIRATSLPKAKSVDKLIWIVDVASALMDAAERNTRRRNSLAYRRASRTAEFVRSQLLTLALPRDKAVQLEVALGDLSERLWAYRAELDKVHPMYEFIARGTAA